MISLVLLAALTPTSVDEVAEKHLAKLRSAYARVQSATVRSTFRKAWESVESPEVELSTVTYFQRPNRILCQVLKRGAAAPFLTYLTDGKRFRRVEDGEVTTGDFDPNESLPRAGVTLETTALWMGETLLRSGSKLLPHPLEGSTTAALSPDGRTKSHYLLMPDDEIAIFIDQKTGLIESIRVGRALDRASGSIGPKYLFRVDRWELGTRFKRTFFDLPKDEGDAIKPGGRAVSMTEMPSPTAGSGFRPRNSSRQTS